MHLVTFFKERAPRRPLHSASTWKRSPWAVTHKVELDVMLEVVPASISVSLSFINTLVDDVVVVVVPNGLDSRTNQCMAKPPHITPNNHAITIAMTMITMIS